MRILSILFRKKAEEEEEEVIKKEKSEEVQSETEEVSSDSEFERSGAERRGGKKFLVFGISVMGVILGLSLLLFFLPVKKERTQVSYLGKTEGNYYDFVKNETSYSESEISESAVNRVSSSVSQVQINGPSEGTDTVERDIFKEFYINKNKTYVEEKNKEVKTPPSSPPPSLSSTSPIFLPPVPLTTPSAEEGKKKEEVSVLKVYGVICESRKCVAVTSLGEFQEGERLGSEVIKKIDKNKITTDKRIIFF